MGQHIKIDDFGAKVELVLRSDKAAIKTRAELLKKLPNIQPDYFTRIVKGQRPLSERIFLDICNALGFDQKEWYSDLETFGIRLGFSRHQIAQITGVLSPGLDFHARNRDQLHSLFDQMEGFWESYYYSVSNTERKAVSRDLLIVSGVTNDLFIECQIVDGISTYVGHCFPTKGGHLCFILEKLQPTNEIIMYLTNYPERHPPMLNGIILCLSGGVGQSFRTYPAASKVAFRYLGGEVETIRKIYRRTPKTSDRAELEKFLRKAVPDYIFPDELGKDDRQWEAIGVIDNKILPDTIPFALRMDI